jgi:hypothetical protein
LFAHKAKASRAGCSSQSRDGDETECCAQAKQECQDGRQSAAYGLPVYWKLEHMDS